jgi:hypothetical protein
MALNASSGLALTMQSSGERGVLGRPTPVDGTHDLTGRIAVLLVAWCGCSPKVTARPEGCAVPITVVLPDAAFDMPAGKSDARATKHTTSATIELLTREKNLYARPRSVLR